MDFDDIIATSKQMSPRAIASSCVIYCIEGAVPPYYVEPVIVGLECVSVPIYSDHDRATEVMAIDSLEHLQAQQIIYSIIGQSNRHKHAQKDRRYKTVQRVFMNNDMLGARSTSSTYVCSGVASRSLHGTAEALWRPNLEAEELVEVCGKALVSALERDCLRFI